MTTHMIIPMSQVGTQNHPVVSPRPWVAERKALLAHEKALTRFGDQIAHERRALPWGADRKTYTFDTPWARARWPSNRSASARGPIGVSNV